MTKVIVWAGVSLAMVAGCGDDDTEATIGTSTGAGDVGGGGGVDPKIAALLACEESDFAVSMPFTGPVIDDETGTFGELDQAEYVVHSTLLVYKPEGLNEIFQLSGDILAELPEAPGFVAVSLAGSEACQNLRTLGVWESEEAMFSFVTGDAHGKAMSRTGAVSLTGKSTSWTASGAEVGALDWDVAKAKISSVDPFPVY